ncbi:MAG TPA: hypothetical protein PKD64_02400 [Pirellulaceae bacterium]|nr:hypothetical protein [Pirellulaceae bacterium]HMO91019.1 hypothetical protein [Pirellulaceae bacterium]HMP68134.1 hypothetical protein [Pirellulaceae bacterium]
MQALTTIPIDDFLKRAWETARSCKWLWLAPVLACTFISLVYALLGPRSYVATQAFVVRDDMAKTNSPGRFDSLDSMKTAQETIVRVTKSINVVRKTLERLGDSTDMKSIETLQNAISFNAPDGAEFGKTEILLLRVKDRNRDKSVQIVSILFEELEQELRTLRKNRAASMEQEMKLASEFAKNEWDVIASELSKIEAELGVDLIDLRSMNEAFANQGTLAKQLDQVRSEVRPAAVTSAMLREQLAILERAQHNPNEILATPNELLEAQPALRRLKDGLIDAQLRLAKLSGDYTADHRKTVAAQRAVDDVSKKIRQELDAAVDGLKIQVGIANTRLRNLETNERELVNRLNELANLRVDYGKLVDDYQQRRENYRRTLEQYALAKAAHVSASQVDLIQRSEEAYVGSRASGPGKTSLVAGGILAGLAIGVGLILLFTPSSPINQAESLSHISRNSYLSTNSQGVPAVAAATTAPLSRNATDDDEKTPERTPVTSASAAELAAAAVASQSRDSAKPEHPSSAKVAVKNPGVSFVHDVGTTDADTETLPTQPTPPLTAAQAQRSVMVGDGSNRGQVQGLGKNKQTDANRPAAETSATETLSTQPLTSHEIQPGPVNPVPTIGKTKEQRAESGHLGHTNITSSPKVYPHAGSPLPSPIHEPFAELPNSSEAKVSEGGSSKSSRASEPTETLTEQSIANQLRKRLLTTGSSLDALKADSHASSKAQARPATPDQRATSSSDDTGFASQPAVMKPVETDLSNIAKRIGDGRRTEVSGKQDLTNDDLASIKNLEQRIRRFRETKVFILPELSPRQDEPIT